MTVDWTVAACAVIGLVFAGSWLLLLPWLLTRRKSRNALWLGLDGRPSTSKFQFWIWTGVILFGYTFLYAFRAWHLGNLAPLDSFPKSLLIAMGLSGTTLVAAKAITTGSVQSGKVDKSVGTSAPLGGLVTDDAGQPDLPKIQLLAWTFVAVAIFVVQIFGKEMPSASPQLPDIDGSLLVLMGLGQGAYLGTKLVTTDTPRLLALIPASVRPGATVTLTGASLGDQSASQLTFDGVVVPATVASWTDARVEFVVPSKRPTTGADWGDGVEVLVGVISEGVTGVGQQRLTVGVTPVIQKVAPASPPGNATGITIDGAFFGATQGIVTVEGISANVSKWSDGEIVFDLPRDAAGKPWATGTQLRLVVQVGANASRASVLIVR
jgi:hypothetical protein